MFSLTIIVLAIVVLSSSPSSPSSSFVTAYRCSLQLPHIFSIRAKKMVDVLIDHHVFREDDWYCGYSFQKLFAQFDDNATQQVMSVNDDLVKAKRLVAADILIDDVKLVSYTMGKPKTKSGKSIDPSTNEILLTKLRNETKVRLVEPFLERAIEKQDSASDRGKREKWVIDEEASKDNHVLYYLTVSTLGNFFHCEFEVNRTDLTSDQEVVLNVEFTSNYPCLKKDADFDEDDGDADDEELELGRN